MELVDRVVACMEGKTHMDSSTDPRKTGALVSERLAAQKPSVQLRGNK